MVKHLLLTSDNKMISGINFGHDHIICKSHVRITTV